MSPMVMMALKVVEPMLRSVLAPGSTDKLMKELRIKALEVDETEIKAQQSLLLAEINSKNKLASSWRPHMMYLMGSVVGLIYIVMPICNTVVFPVVAFLVNMIPGIDPVETAKFEKLEVPVQVWTLITISVPGYMGLRHLEKRLGVASGDPDYKPPTFVSNVVKRLTGQSKPKPAPPPVRTFREQPVDRSPPDLDYDLAELPVEKKD